MNLNKIRTRGEPPSLSDSEVITLEIVGEYLGYGSDKAIWSYFKNHWKHYFPDMSCRTSFSRQCANCYELKKNLQQAVSNVLSRGTISKRGVLAENLSLKAYPNKLYIFFQKIRLQISFKTFNKPQQILLDPPFRDGPQKT